MIITALHCWSCFANCSQTDRNLLKHNAMENSEAVKLIFEHKATHVNMPRASGFQPTFSSYMMSAMKEARVKWKWDISESRLVVGNKRSITRKKIKAFCRLQSRSDRRPAKTKTNLAEALLHCFPLFCYPHFPFRSERKEDSDEIKCNNYVLCELNERRPGAELNPWRVELALKQKRFIFAACLSSFSPR